MPAKTPAHRRFAPPSNKSVPTTSRAPFINRLARTSQPSNSPSTRKSPPNVIVDEEEEEEDVDVIDADEQDEDNLLPQHISTTFRGYNSKYADHIDANDDELGNSSHATHTHTAIHSQQKDRNRPQATQAPSHITSTSSTKRRKLSHFISEPIDHYGSEASSSPTLQPSSPSARIPGRQNTQVEVPHSSPESPEPPRAAAAAPHPHDSIEATDDHAAEYSDPADHSPIAQDIATPKKHTRHSNPISRFKSSHHHQQYPIPPSSSSATLLTQPDPATTYQQPLPSFQSRLLASSSGAISTGPHLRGPQPSLDYTLPDAFSPSRRRGNREYIHGGYAETVRGWVLDLAVRTNVNGDTNTNTNTNTSSNSNSAAKPNQALHSSSKDPTILVGDIVLRDPAGRFLVIKATETAVAEYENGGNHDDRRGEGGAAQETVSPSWWLLTNVDQHPVQSHGVVSKFDRVKPGVEIVVKGGEAATWTHELNELSLVDVSRIRVAVLWDIAK